MDRLLRTLVAEWKERWGQFLMAAAAGLLTLLAIYGVMTLTPNIRSLELSRLPLAVLLVALNAFIFAYVLHIAHGKFQTIKKSVVKPERVNVQFSEVIGSDEAKREAREVVALIKDRVKLRRAGGQIIKGFLMMGPPGCGKTLLAKAIATESGVPFLATAGTEYTEMFVGVGAARVRRMFREARKLAFVQGGCILFIDELEVLGAKRTFVDAGFGGTRERDSTLNQLLVEMDGLEAVGHNVVVIGATNAPLDVIDSALLRPGRFDRKIHIVLPSVEDRLRIFKHYLARVKHDASVNPERLARKTVGRSPADIQNVVQEAALIALRRAEEKPREARQPAPEPVVSERDVAEALDRIDLGVLQRVAWSERERQEIAFRQAGTVVTLYEIHPGRDVFKASILSRGGVAGAVQSNPREESYAQNRLQLIADVKVALAGHAAEKIRFGMTTTGSAQAFKGATELAHDMAWKHGMGPEGWVGDFTAIPSGHLSADIASRLNEQAREILERCLKETEEFLRKEWPIVEKIASALLEKEELNYDEIEAIMTSFNRRRRAPLGVPPLNASGQPFIIPGFTPPANGASAPPSPAPPEKPAGLDPLRPPPDAA